MAKAKGKTVKARVLLDVSIDGVIYRADQVVEFDEGLAKQAKEGGQIDDHPDAVAYCLKNGAEVVAHATSIEPESGEEVAAEEGSGNA